MSQSSLPRSRMTEKIWRNVIVNDANQNVYVGDGNIRLYTYENHIAKKLIGL